MDKQLIDNVVIEGIDPKDYPDFCDTFIASADHMGRPMTEEELDEINEDYEYVYEQVEKFLY